MYLEKEAIDYFRRYEFYLPVYSIQQGDNRSRIIGHNMEFEQYNPYNPGDNIRDIDWKVFARSDKLFVKNYGSDLRSRVRIIIDNSKSMAYGDKLETAKRIAAIFQHILTNRKNQVFLSVINDYYSDYERLLVSNLEETLESIKTIGKTRITEIPPLSREAVFLISDLWEKDLDIHTLLRNRINVIHLLTPEETDLSIHGNFELLDMETQSKVNVIPKDIRDKYRKMIHNRITEYHKEFTACGLLYGVFSTDTAYYVNLKKYLEKIKTIKKRGKL